jgi:hypothetical protein
MFPEETDRKSEIIVTAHPRFVFFKASARVMDWTRR